MLKLHLILTMSVFMLCACDSKKPEPQPQSAHKVEVAKVVSEPFTQWITVNARTESPRIVNLKPRVSGYIEQVLFSEGDYVNKGELLYTLDDEMIASKVAQLTANLAETENQYQLAKLDYHRAQSLTNRQSISQSQLDSLLAKQEQTSSRVLSVKAELSRAQLEQSYTKVTAPISGRISSTHFTEGNLVQAQTSLLTTVTDTQMLYAWFNLDEMSYIQLRNNFGQHFPLKATVSIPQLNNLEKTAEVDFFDTNVDPLTGTIRGRVKFANTNNTFVPGQFTKVKIYKPMMKNLLLIRKEALATDLNSRFVYIVDHNQIVQHRKVEVGKQYQNFLEVTSGLNKNELIIINGLQKVQSGSPVTYDVKPMLGRQAMEELTHYQKNSTEEQLAQSEGGSSRGES